MLRIANYSPYVFHGFKRVTVDTPLPHESGYFSISAGHGGGYFYGGRRIGTDARVVDVMVALQPGQVRELDLSVATPQSFTLAPLPPDPLAFFGLPSIAGVGLTVLSVQPDGAGYDIHLRARVGRMFVVDVWLVYYPSKPGWMSGEVVVTASNPSVADMQATIPSDFYLRLGPADIIVPGAAPGATLLPAGTTFADGQARSFPFAAVWRQHLRTLDDLSSAIAASQLAISANGIGKLWPSGNPILATDAQPLDWSRAHWPGAVASLHRWEPEPGVGPNKRSADTGAQADQVFVGAECMGAQGLGAETVRYLVALSQSRRPCQHREPDGSPLDLARHPRLVLWDARPHIPSVSPDQLGKTRKLGESEAAGWYGPDVEHWLISNLTVAARLTGSPALQLQLAAQARIYLLTHQTDKSRFPYQAVPFAARAVGWEGIAVVLLWTNLEDRALAESVKARWLERLDAVLLPDLGAATNDIWDVRLNDPRLGLGEWWMPWQQAVGAYGLDLAGRTFARPDACALALRGAKRAMDAWQLTPTGWLTYWNLAVDGRGVLTHDANNFGMPLAVAVVLKHEPNDPKAVAVWSAIAPGGGQWIPPEAPR